MCSMYDVAVVGAGPAGSATAAFLAERGFDVALLERARFPRPKPCAEYLSPQASCVLERLGLLPELDAEQPARLRGMRIVSPNGTSFTGCFAGPHLRRAHRDHGLALPRSVLDAHLAGAAVARGADFMQQTLVEGFTASSNGGLRLAVRRHGRQEMVDARFVVGADGLNSRVARALGVSRQGRRRRVALVAHAAGVAGVCDVGEMHVGASGYAGLAPIGHGLTNVALVVALDRQPRRDPPESWFRAALQQFPAVAARVGAGRIASPVRAVGPFTRWTTRATADRVLLVGDAADFYDPFTGEGIYAALRGAELAADHLSPALERDQLRAADLAPYDAARRREFRGRWLLERLVSWAVAHPRVFDWAAGRLAAKPDLADLLVGVTGDLIPASQLLRPSYVFRLVR